MDRELENTPIKSLPSEIVCNIMKRIDYRDIIKFSLTCKHFNAIVYQNQYIWKDKLKDILPDEIFAIAEANSEGNWLDDFRTFYYTKKKTISEITGMSAKYFSRVDTIKLEDVRVFFSLALSDDISYYYVIYVLQDIVKQAHQVSDGQDCEKPFTLTEEFYAKTVLRYLVQSYLTMKWVQAHLKSELYPEVVLNFFIQWMDPLHFHLDEDVEEALNGLVEKCEVLLSNEENETPMGIPEKINKGLVTHKQVLNVISQVMYKDLRMTVLNHANLDTLDIVKVIENKCGNPIALATIYHAVAKKCGVLCELIAFPHHLILQWRNVYDYPPQVQYKIVLDSGELIPKGRCPFSNNLGRNAHKYCPDSLLQYIVSAFLMTKGLIKDWYTQNSTHLLDFLSTNTNQENPYRHFLPFLLDNSQIPALNHQVHLKVMNEDHREVIQALSFLNPNPPSVCRDVVIKHRNSSLKYAVGMICYHKKYDYMCVIRGWNLSCSDKQGIFDLKTLRMGTQQPFYNIVAVDQSSRYVAQEDLIEIGRPSRVFHLEDVIAKEFTHFDGFSYVPNAEKEAEYPEDGPIRAIFQARVEQRI